MTDGAEGEILQGVDNLGTSEERGLTSVRTLYSVSPDACLTAARLVGPSRPIRHGWADTQRSDFPKHVQM
jgi:hypothetical protein